MASIYDIDFGDISGAQGGGQNLQNIFNILGEQLMSGGYFGEDWMSGGQMEDLPSPTGEGYGWYQDIEEQGFNLDELLFSLSGNYPESGDWLGGSEEATTGTSSWNPAHAGMSSLYDLLQKINIPGLTKEYGQGVADIQGEIGAKMKELRGGLTGGKGSRYGGLGGMGRNLKGGRKKYLSDYYGLQEQQSEMQQGLQEEMESGFMGNIANWMSMNPYVS